MIREIYRLKKLAKGDETVKILNSAGFEDPQLALRRAKDRLFGRIKFAGFLKP